MGKGGRENGIGMESLRDKARSARDKIHPPRAPEQRARFAEGHREGKRVEGQRKGGREGRREGKRANSGRRGHKSDGHPKVPRNTKQKKDRALASRRWKEDLRESGRLFSNNLPRDVGWLAGGIRRGSGFPALEVEVEEVEEEKEEEEDAGGGK